jgi:transposase
MGTLFLQVDDALWAVAEPVLPPARPPGTRGHPPVPSRMALAGIIFVLKTGIPWEDFPQELGCCGMTLWRRLRDWQAAGAWDRLHHVLLNKLGEADQIDWRRASADGARVPAKGGAPALGRTPPTGANPGRTTIWWSRVVARHWRASRPRPT